MEQGGRGTRQPVHVCRLCLLLARVAALRAEVASLRGHKNHCECATLSLLQELRQVQASVQLQDSELKKLKQEVQQAAWAPEKEGLEVSHHRLGGSSPHPQARLPHS